MTLDQSTPPNGSHTNEQTVQPPRGVPESLLPRLFQDNRFFLQEVPLFRGLPEDQLDTLASHMEEQKFERGDIIIHEGEPNRHIYFIKNGLVGVTRTSGGPGSDEVLSYFHQGHIFGEFGVFSGEQHIATATVRALSKVTVLRLAHEDFTSSLNEYHPAAMEVARILTQRLKGPTDKLIPTPREQRVYLVLGLNKGAGATTIGSTLAAALAKEEGKGSVVYTEYPDGHELPQELSFPPNEFFNHPAGFDIFVPRPMPRLAPAVNINLIRERIQRLYKDFVICMPAKYIHEIGDMVGQASQVILVASPQRWDALRDIGDVLQASPFLDSSRIIRVVNYCRPEYQQSPPPEDADFNVPFLIALDLRVNKGEGIPPKLQEVTAQMADRFSNKNHITLFVPKAADQPNGENPEMLAATEHLMWLMKELFGEVVRKDLEDTITITSHASHVEVNEQWRKVLEEVERTKEKLQQEALALEINNNLVLV